MTNKIEKLLNELNAGDIGQQEIDGYIVKFEGFTPDCWNYAEEENMTTADLETQMLDEWKNLGKLLEGVNLELKKERKMENRIGMMAGQVYQLLSAGPASRSRVQKGIKGGSKELIDMAIGWLAREGKLNFEVKGNEITMSLK